MAVAKGRSRSIAWRIALGRSAIAGCRKAPGDLAQRPERIRPMEVLPQFQRHDGDGGVRREACSGKENSYTPPRFDSRWYCEHVDEAFAPSRLSPFRQRTLHEPNAAGVFPPEAALLADRAAPGIQRNPAAPAGGEPIRARYRRPGLARNRPLARAAHPRSRAQADRQDRRRAAPP